MVREESPYMSSLAPRLQRAPSLAAPGLQVVPVFAGGLDFSAPVKKFFYDPLVPSKAFVNCVISLTGFALVGGPARQVSRVRKDGLNASFLQASRCYAAMSHELLCGGGATSELAHHGLRC